MHIARPLPIGRGKLAVLAAPENTLLHTVMPPHLHGAQGPLITLLLPRRRHRLPWQLGRGRHHAGARRCAEGRRERQQRARACCREGWGPAEGSTRLGPVIGLLQRLDTAGQATDSQQTGRQPASWHWSVSGQWHRAHILLWRCCKARSDAAKLRRSKSSSSPMRLAGPVLLPVGASPGVCANRSCRDTHLLLP